MGRKERSEDQKRICKKEIKEAAQKLFYRNGYAASTMDEIALESDYTKRSIYYYFTGKDDIYFSNVTDGFALLNQMLTEGVKDISNGGSIDKIKKLCAVYFQFALKHPSYFRIILDYENRPEDFKTKNPLIRECDKEAERGFSMLEKTIREGIRDKSIRSDVNAALVTIILWTQISGLLQLISQKRRFLERVRNRKIAELLNSLYDLTDKILR